LAYWFAIAARAQSGGRAAKSLLLVTFSLDMIADDA
jgi:hypothetical protein